MANLPGGFLILAEPSSPLGNLECETSCVKFSSHPVGEASPGRGKGGTVSQTHTYVTGEL